MEPSDDGAVLRAVFSKYDTKDTGYLSLQQFTFLITRLRKYVPELRGVEFAEAQSAFALFDKDGDKRLSFSEFREWWTSKDRYSYFSGEKAVLLRKAYALYSEYLPEKGKAALNISKFSEMMEALGITYTESDFDRLDKNEDGLISFDEFCEWLDWF